LDELEGAKEMKMKKLDAVNLAASSAARGWPGSYGGVAATASALESWTTPVEQ
jgi:hypothetical protein